MTQLRAWKCDICGKEFIEKSNDPTSLNPGDFSFEFGTVNMFIGEIKESYNTICIDCRNIMKHAINDGLEKCGADHYIF